MTVAYVIPSLRFPGSVFSHRIKARDEIDQSTSAKSADARPRGLHWRKNRPGLIARGQQGLVHKLRSEIVNL
jgi:hypothetical protein